MIRKKICLLGAFAVGKTSLASRFVHGIFSEKYKTTVGVKIDKRMVDVDERPVTLLVWDLSGEDAFQSVQASYLRGSAGYLLVADGTRSGTLDVAIGLQQRAAEVVGDVPFVLLLNKRDLESSWEVDDARIAELVASGWDVLRTSAKTGEGVEKAFARLARRAVGIP